MYLMGDISMVKHEWSKPELKSIEMSATRADKGAFPGEAANLQDLPAS